VLGLFCLLVGFSIAYVWLDAGVGAVNLCLRWAGDDVRGWLDLGPRKAAVWPLNRHGIAMGGLVFLFLPRIGAAPEPLG